MFECRGILNTDQFIRHQFDNILFDLPEVSLYLLLHRIIAVLVQKVADFRIGLMPLTTTSLLFHLNHLCAISGCRISGIH